MLEVLLGYSTLLGPYVLLAAVAAGLLALSIRQIFRIGAKAWKAT